MFDYVRDNIRKIAGYTPGEQPRGNDFIKLNTNESPYPPSPRVVEAIERVLREQRLRKYPDPLGTHFRETAGRILGVDPESILIGNGSDDVLTILTRTIVPEQGLIVSPTPSYLLYRTLAELQDAEFRVVPFAEDWTLPDPWPHPNARLTLLANPNSPSGTRIKNVDLQRFIAGINGIVVIDEAYVDFADEHALGLHSLPNVVVTRSFSKSYALAGLRMGFAVARAEFVREFNKMKDSYNCNALSLAGAAAALEDQEYFRSMRDRIITARARLEGSLQRLGFRVTPSQANFVWCRRDDQPHRPIYEKLKDRMILIRYMNYEGYGDGLRITVGTDQEIDKLLEELARIV